MPITGTDSIVRDISWHGLMMISPVDVFFASMTGIFGMTTWSFCILSTSHHCICFAGWLVPKKYWTPSERRKAKRKRFMSLILSMMFLSKGLVIFLCDSRWFSNLFLKEYNVFLKFCNLFSIFMIENNSFFYREYNISYHILSKISKNVIKRSSPKISIDASFCCFWWEDDTSLSCSFSWIEDICRQNIRKERFSFR